MRVDLNADLGEGEPWARTRALLRIVTSANIACGGHAGAVGSMERTVAAAAAAGVRVGAHPGLADGFGRGAADVDPEALRLLLLQQVGTLERIARRAGVRLHHVKLHGALYHAADARPDLADAFLGTLVRWFPRVRVYARPGGAVASRAPDHGARVWAEGFADRGYRSDGSLVPRGESGALLARPAEVADRIAGWRKGGGVRAVDGAMLPLAVRTWCVHGDTPGAVAMARAARGELGTSRRM